MSRQFRFEAPTPQNTPASVAPISGSSSNRTQQPTIASIPEDGEADLGRVLASDPKLVGMIQNKLGTLVGKSSGYIESLPEAVQRRIVGLKGVQHAYSEMELQFQEEILELEKKYLEKYRPLYARRVQIITGQAEPTEEEIAAGGSEVEAAASTATPVGNNEMKGVPEFWLTAMKNMVPLADLITAKDEQVLKYLTDISLQYLSVPGFKLVFVFSDEAKAFFSNGSLSKSYFYQWEAGYGGDFIYDHAEGEEVQWVDGKDMTMRVEIKKQRNKNTKMTRVVKKSVPQDSFFNFFKPPTMSPDLEEGGEMTEEEEEVDNRLKLDYSLGEEIKEKLIPHAIDWYTGEALQYEEFDDDPYGEEDDYSDKGDDDDEDEDEDDEEEDDDDEDARQHASKPKQDPAECKQQ